MKFNRKLFTGKKRIFEPVPGHVGVCRLWIWSENRQEYVSPKYGKSYVARKPRDRATGKRESQFFPSLDEAWNWLRWERRPQALKHHEASTSIIVPGRTLRQVICHWKQERWPHLSESTRIMYENRLKAFEPFLDLPVEAITPSIVDNFLKHLKSPEMVMTYQATRVSFDKELELLKTILNWYLKMYDEAKLILPFKKRHEEMAILKKKPEKKYQFMQESQVKPFLEALGANNKFYHDLAVVQLGQVMRISEVCAMKFSNLDLKNGTYRLSEHVVWPRKNGKQPYLSPGTKSISSETTIPLRESTIEILSRMPRWPGCDLIFHDEGKLLTYRQVQNAFDNAFKAANLPFSGTHVLRHTGATLFLNETGDTLALTQMGNWSNPEMALHYGKILKERAGKAVREADRRLKLQLIQSEQEQQSG